MAKAPDTADAIFAEALLAQQAGRLTKAGRLYRQVLSINPSHADSLHLLGVISYQTGNDASAVTLITKAIAIDAKAASYRSNLGLALERQGKLEDAANCHRIALGLQPDFPEAHYNLGRTLQAQGRPDEAAACYRQAIALKPDFASAQNNLGNVLEECGWLDEAIASYRKAIALEPGQAAFRNNLGVVLRRQGRLDEAIACYRASLDLKPDYAEAHYNFGVALKEFGQFEDAAAAYAKAIRLGADPCVSYYELTGCRKFTQADRSLVEKMQAHLDDSKISDTGRSQLHFGLGKVFDDLGEYDAAIRHFDLGNAIERARHPFDREGFTALINRLIAAFPQGGSAPATSDSELPIFIVGMPRSGTTLVEQILASHPKVAAGGELSFWFQKMHANFGPEHEMIRDYLDLLRGIGPQMLRVTDKLPYNFLSLGLLQKLFPKARIVHCRRNPVDTALSIYFSRFAQANDFAYCRDDIVHYYREYRRLMNHWRTILSPDKFIEIDYEQLVVDPESNSRRLVAFCGLDWDDACLNFPAATRPINTLSGWQARQPIYKSSVERWRHYEPWLGTLRALAS